MRKIAWGILIVFGLLNATNNTYNPNVYAFKGLMSYKGFRPLKNDPNTYVCYRIMNIDYQLADFIYTQPQLFKAIILQHYNDAKKTFCDLKQRYLKNNNNLVAKTIYTIKAGNYTYKFDYNFSAKDCNLNTYPKFIDKVTKNFEKKLKTDWYKKLYLQDRSNNEEGFFKQLSKAVPVPLIKYDLLIKKILLPKKIDYDNRDNNIIIFYIYKSKNLSVKTAKKKINEFFEKSYYLKKGISFYKYKVFLLDENKRILATATIPKKVPKNEGKGYTLDDIANALAKKEVDDMIREGIKAKEQENH